MAFLSTFVGVGKHTDPNVRDLIGSTRDAIALHALFADTFPESNPQLLLDHDATLANIRVALRETLGKATADDVVVFFFSGHGSHDHKLAASDTELSNLARTTIGMDELAAFFRSTKARAVFCILDCCFSGGAPAKVLEDSPVPRDTAAPLETLIGEGRILLAASGINELAYEMPQARHGILTKALLDVLLDATGPVDILSSSSEVMSRVRAEAARQGITQNPVILGTVKGGLAIPKLTPGKNFFAAFPELKHVKVSPAINDLLQLGFPPATVAAWKERYAGGLNPLQLAAINDKGVVDGNSLLVIAPTSAGKTFVGELSAAKAMAEGKKAVFLLPYKALVNEKYDQFTELYKTQLGFRVIRCSGDYSDQVGAFYKGKYDLALLTYEMFLQLVVGTPFSLNQIGLVVLDEAQFITDPSRGISVELLLTFILAAREKGISPQIIALSAVIGDANNFNRWLGCDLLFSTERPVPLLEGVIDRNGTFQFLDETGTEGTEQILRPYEVQQRREKPSGQDLFVPLVKKLVSVGEKVIVFRNQRGFAQGAANYLAEDLGLPPATDALRQLPESDLSSASAALRRCLRGGTAFHNSNLTREERIVVEQAFRDPKNPLRVLVATTTVAAGINTPASTVVLAENEFVGEDGRPFTVAEYKNMAGRAGRLGFNEKGKSMIYAETPHERQLLFRKYVRGQLERLHSSFDPGQIETWLVRLLVQVEKLERDSVSTLLLNTYAGFVETMRDPGWRDRMRAHVDHLVGRMISLGLIEVEGSAVRLSLLGRACGRSSLSFDSAMRLIEIIKNVPPHLLTATNLMALMQGLPAEEMGYTPLVKGTKENVRVNQASLRFGHEITRALQNRARDILEFYGRCKRASVLFDWISGKRLDQIEAEFSTNAYFGRIEYGDIRRFADTTRFHLQSASDIIAILLLDKYPQSELAALLVQLEVGFPAHALGLLELPMTLTRGEYLNFISLGITTPDQFWAVGREIISKALAESRVQYVEKFRPQKASAAAQ
ncbi:MAG: DEAD/DEAH box helicase [Terriglobales bacterium]|jgi:replicative superfamily II helicase